MAGWELLLAELWSLSGEVCMTSVLTTTGTSTGEVSGEKWGVVGGATPSPHRGGRLRGTSDLPVRRLREIICSFSTIDMSCWGPGLSPEDHCDWKIRYHFTLDSVQYFIIKYQ